MGELVGLLEHRVKRNPVGALPYSLQQDEYRALGICETRDEIHGRLRSAGVKEGLLLTEQQLWALHREHVLPELERVLEDPRPIDVDFVRFLRGSVLAKQVYGALHGTPGRIVVEYLAWSLSRLLERVAPPKSLNTPLRPRRDGPL